MIQKIKNLMLVAASAFMLAAPVAAPAAVYAQGCNTNIQNKVAEGAGGASGNPNSVRCEGATATGSKITKLAQDIVNIFSIIVGAVAVIMIIYGGFRYITSGGDSNRVGSAKNTLIYAVIGLIIVALAQIIVRVVLTQTSQVST